MVALSIHFVNVQILNVKRPRIVEPDDGGDREAVAKQAPDQMPTEKPGFPRHEDAIGARHAWARLGRNQRSIDFDSGVFDPPAFSGGLLTARRRHIKGQGSKLQHQIRL
jgi:hypothetical protein